MYKSLDEGLALIRSLDPADPISMENNNQLIHISGPLATTKVKFQPLIKTPPKKNE